jgi:hypothetical protein
MTSYLLFWSDSVAFAAAGRGDVAPAIDDAACGVIANVYAVRSFSLGFDLDQQSIG